MKSTHNDIKPNTTSMKPTEVPQKICITSILRNYATPTVDGQKHSAPNSFSHSSVPWSRRGTRITGNESYKPLGAP